MSQFSNPNSLNVSPEILARILGDKPWKLTPATMAAHVSKGKWVPARHLMFLSTIITSHLMRGNAFLIVSVPPRHGKSEFSSVWSPTWIFEHSPSKEIVLTTYGADLATDFSRKVRDHILNDNELTIKLRDDAQKVATFLTADGGGLRAVGIGGPIYGRGADIFILDDYYKNPEEAYSQEHRDKVFNWFISIAMSRLATGGSVIIVATRWDPDDLSGRLLNMPGSMWKEIKLPAIAYQPEEFPFEGYVDPIGRLPGEALWPEKYSAEHLAVIKRLVGSYFWSSIYQQKPRKNRSGMFDERWVKYVSMEEVPDPAYLRFVRSWDLAGTEDGGDWTAGTLLARDIRNRNVYILDVKRKQLSPKGVESLVQSTTEQDIRRFKRFTETVIEQEPGSAGKAVIEHYQSVVLKGNICKGIKPSGPKQIRANPYLAAFEAGEIFLVKAAWNDPFVEEHLIFPTDGNNGHDDIVDSCSQGYNYIFEKKSKAGAWGRTTSNIIVPGSEALDEMALIQQLHPAVAEQVIQQSNQLRGVVWGRNR